MLTQSYQIQNQSRSLTTITETLTSLNLLAINYNSTLEYYVSEDYKKNGPRILALVANTASSLSEFSFSLTLRSGNNHTLST